MARPNFYERLKQHQAVWADAYGISRSERETNGNRPWVLKPTFKTRNLYRPTWWRHIEGREHRWARSLTSSQCFAVNLFAPIEEDQDLAAAVFARLFPDRPFSARDLVGIEFEYSPAGGPGCLGERRQPTQVDVCFVVRRDKVERGRVLVEVKLGESEFGSCRGARRHSDPRKGNPKPERCLDLPALLAEPAKRCWLVETEGRAYWRWILNDASSFSRAALEVEPQCPFRGGLYQLMRNRVLADALVAEGQVEWADVAVCLHPGNTRARKLANSVAQMTDAVDAFDALLACGPIGQLDPRSIITGVTEGAPGMTAWADWMKERYLLK